MAYRMSEESPWAEHALQTIPSSQSIPMERLDSYQNPPKDLLEDVLPEAPAYGDPSGDVSFHLNIAAHSSRFDEAFQKDDEDQYLNYGTVNPNDALQPPFCSRDNFNNINQLANLSLEDVESVLQFDQGSLEFQTPSRNSSASFKDELGYRYCLSSIHTASHEPGGLPSTYPMGPDLYTSPPLASTTNSHQHQELLETYDYSTPASGVNGPFPYHPNYSHDQLLPETTDQLNAGGMGVQPSSYLPHETLFAHNHFQQAAPNVLYQSSPEADSSPNGASGNYANYLPHETSFAHNALNHFQQAEPSQPYQSSHEADSSSNSASGIGNSSEFAHSRKGYKHRHQRIYGLSEEDKKRRNQELNNEASQLYRRRKTTTLKELETQLRQEEERKGKLTKKHQKLCKQIEIYKRALYDNGNTSSLREQSIYKTS